MKKTLVRTPKRRLGFKSFSLRARLGGAAALLALTAALGLAAERPAHTAGGPIAVNVANTPLATTPTDEAAPRQPFTAQTFYLIRDGSESGGVEDGYTDIAVPAGKRLVIQTVSFYHQENNKETVQAFVTPVTNGTGFVYALPSVPSNGTADPGATLPMMVYADAGSTVHFTVFRSQSSGPELVNFTVSGYLVNV